MAELKIKCRDYVIRKVRTHGAVSTKELEKGNIKVIPMPWNTEPRITHINEAYDCITLTSNEVINREVVGSKKNVYLSPMYMGAEVLIVPADSIVWLKKVRSYKKNTYDCGNCRELTLGQSYKKRILSIFSPLDDVNGYYRINELIMKATADKGSTACNVYIPKHMQYVRIFDDEIYEY